MAFLQNIGDVENEVFEKKIAFFSFFMLEKWKQKNKENGKTKKPYKNSVFKVVIQKCEIKKMDFLQKLPDTICGRKGEKTHFRAHYLFWPKDVLAQKNANQKKTIKIVVSAEIAQNPK